MRTIKKLSFKKLVAAATVMVYPVKGSETQCRVEWEFNNNPNDLEVHTAFCQSGKSLQELAKIDPIVALIDPENGTAPFWLIQQRQSDESPKGKLLGEYLDLGFGETQQPAAEQIAPATETETETEEAQAEAAEVQGDADGNQPF